VLVIVKNKKVSPATRQITARKQSRGLKDVVATDLMPLSVHLQFRPSFFVIRISEKSVPSLLLPDIITRWNGFFPVANCGKYFLIKPTG
jgi:hypothetical protein